MNKTNKKLKLHILKIKLRKLIIYLRSFKILIPFLKISFLNQINHNKFTQNNFKIIKM
jgi:hypothetical protein